MGFAREALNKEVALRKNEQEDLGSIPSLYKCFFSIEKRGRKDGTRHAKFARSRAFRKFSIIKS